MEKERLVIIGAGMAATRLVEELAVTAPGRYAITLIGEEPASPYNRVLLSSALAGEVALDDIGLKPVEWWRAAEVEMITGRKATHIYPATRFVALEDGEFLPYEKLVLATGSKAIRLPVEGANLPGVHTFRDMIDTRALAALGAAGARVLVVGGGLLGLEAAYGLVRRGARVTLAHVMDRLMERQLDADGAKLLHRIVEDKGVRVMLNANLSRLGGTQRVEAAHFADGQALDVDAVVFAVGVRANADLARDAGLAVERGVIVNDGLATSAPGIFAVGECAEHCGVCYGLVDPAYRQAAVLAARLAGGTDSYQGSVTATNLKVSGVRVFSAGDYLGGNGASEIICKDPRMGVYRRLVTAGDRLIGAILIGDTSGALTYSDLIRSGESISGIRDELMFGASALARAA
jgi:nitrite reductase (NADH) large subunit